MTSNTHTIYCEIISLENAPVGQEVTIIGSDGPNPTIIRDGESFVLSGDWLGSAGDMPKLMCDGL